MRKLAIMLIALMVVSIGLLSGCNEQTSDEENEIKETITYLELINDIKLISLPSLTLFTLQSYEDGEVIYIKDTVYNVSYQDPYTYVLFINPASLGGAIDYTAIRFMLAINGDKRNEYSAGKLVTIPVHVEVYEINGTIVTWLDEWYNIYVYMMGGMLPSEDTGKTISALKTGSDLTHHTATYMVTHADDDIVWADVTVSWNGGGGNFGDELTTTSTSTNIEDGDYFTINFGASGTYTPDLICDGSIIWTAPTVTV